MVDVRITLAGLWVAVMLTYFLGDVLRVFAGHVVPGEIQGKRVSQGMWVLIAAIMLIPIIMLVLCLTLPYPAIRWVTLVAAAFSVVFNLAGLPYEGAYDNFLIGVSIVFCGLIVWYAWTWPALGYRQARALQREAQPAVGPTSGSSRTYFSSAPRLGAAPLHSSRR